MDTPRATRATGIVTVLLILLGYTGAFLSLYSPLKLSFVLKAAAGATAVHLASCQRLPGSAWTVLRWAGRAMMVPIAGFLAYLAVALGSLLVWSFTLWIWAVLALFLGGAIATAIRPWRGLRIPIVLPMGAWIAACLLGWSHNGQAVRCDDIHRLTEQPGTTLLASSLGQGVTCSPGTTVHPPGHPRKLYPTRDAHRWLASANVNHSPDVAGTFTGGICVLTLAPDDNTSRVDCAFEGTYQLAYSPDRDEVYGVGRAGIVRSTAKPPLEALAIVPADNTRSIPNQVLHFPTLAPDTIDVFYDGFENAERRRYDDLAVVEHTQFGMGPEEVRFDPERREGVHCLALSSMMAPEGKGFLALAWREDPRQVRRLGTSDQLPWTIVAFSDGCDFDVVRRRVYAGIATLGLIAVLDYDTGDLLDVFWAGLGLRSVVLNAEGTTLYTSSYLPGDVREIDTRTGVLTRRWFPGRFVRNVQLAEDGAALYVTSTLGIVRIPLSRSSEVPRAGSQKPPTFTGLSRE